MPLPESIRGLAPFATMSSQEQEELAAVATLRPFEEEENIYHAGEEADALYVLIAGAVRLEDPELSRLTALTLPCVDQIGALVSKGSILRAFEHRHRLVGVQPGTLLELPRDAFQKLFDSGSGAAYVLVDYLLRELTEEVRDLNAGIQRLLAEG